MLIVKSIIYRIIRVFILFTISILVGRDINIAISISVIDLFVATIYYYFFEIIWEKIDKKKGQLNV